MINLTLRQLRYFDALARHGHFGRAAQACSVTQPALSMQIKDLEAAFGGLLIERNARHVALTAFGEDAARRVRDILQAVEDLGEIARASSGQGIRQLRLGMIPTVAPYMLPAMLAELTRSFPELDVHVRETVTPNLIRDLMDGLLDSAIVALPVSEPTLTEVALFSETFLLVRPKADAAKPIPSREALRDMRLLLLEEGHCFRDQALTFCKMQARPAREILDASSLTTLVQMVAAGIGVTLIPEMARAVETRSAAVSLSRFASPQPHRTIGMVWRKTNLMAPRLLQIAEAVSRAAGTNAIAKARLRPARSSRQKMP